MNLVCRACGLVGLTPTGSNGSSIVVTCDGCVTRYEVTSDIDHDGLLYVVNGLPEELKAIGHIPTDPWVSLEIRMTLSQRSVIQQAISNAGHIVGIESSMTAGRALELICADFLAGDGVGTR